MISAWQTEQALIAAKVDRKFFWRCGLFAKGLYVDVDVSLALKIMMAIVGPKTDPAKYNINV